MSVPSLLNTDVGELPARFGAFFVWWGHQLSALLAPFLRPLAASSKATVSLQETGPESWRLSDARGEVAPSPRRRAVALRLSPETVLRRIAPVPPLGARDAERLVLLDADRLTPFPPEAAYHRARAMPSPSGASYREVELVSVSKASADALLSRARDAGYEVRAVLAWDGGAAEPCDILPLMPRDAPADIVLKSITWTIALLLVAANIALAYTRNLQSTQALEAVAALQHARAAEIRALTVRTSGLQTAVERARAGRAASEPLSVLDQLARTLPPETTVRRLTWDGATLRVSGTKPAGRDLASELRRAGSWRSVVDMTPAGVLTPNAFDIALQPVSRRPPSLRTESSR